MLILLRRNIVIMVAAVAIVSVLIVAVIGYSAVIQAPELDTEQAKTLAERVLFIAIVTNTAVFLAAGIALYHAVAVNSILRRLVTLNRAGSSSMEKALERLGDTGTQILLLQKQISTLSAQKSTRINAMNALVGALTARSNQPILLVNSAGTVYRATPPILKTLDKNAAEVVGKHVDTLFEAELFSATVASIERHASVHVFREKKQPVAVVPVHNDQEQTAYYVYYLGDQARVEEKAAAEREKNRDKPA